MNSRRKERKGIFFLHLLLLIFHIDGIVGQNLDPLISSLMNFPRFDAIRLEELRNRSVEVRSRFVYNDLFRKQVNGVSALTWNGVIWDIDAFVARPGARFGHAINLFYRGSRRWFENKKDRTALYVNDRNATNRGGFQLAITDGRGLLGVGLEVYSASSEIPIWVKAFPGSKDSAMHKYFLDWLEPTFGRLLDITANRELQKPILFVSIPTFQRKRITLFLAHSSFSSRPEILYVNSSNKPELAGNRKIDIPFKFEGNLFDISLKNKSESSGISATFFRSRFSLDFDNNPPQTAPILLDYEELGHGEGSRRGFSLKYGVKYRNYDFRFGLGRSHYSADFKINTPVLGYYKNVFPIAHGVEGKVVGNSFSQTVEATFHKRIISTESFLKAGYTHSFFGFRLDGDALLEFNLISIPVHYPLRYHVHIVEIAWRLERRFGPYRGFYSFTQFIPFVVRSDTSPIRLSKDVPGVSTKSRGGGIHQFVVSYQW